MRLLCTFYFTLKSGNCKGERGQKFVSLFGLHQNRLHLDAFKCRFRRLRQELHMRNERGWFALRIILTEWNEIDVARVKKPSDVLPGRRQAVIGRYGD